MRYPSTAPPCGLSRESGGETGQGRGKSKADYTLFTRISLFVGNVDTENKEKVVGNMKYFAATGIFHGQFANLWTAAFVRFFDLTGNLVKK
jgi:hypothetical protein